MRPAVKVPMYSSSCVLSTVKTCETFTTLCLGRFASRFSSKTLPGALAELRAGDVLEIRGNGPFQVGPVNVDGPGLRLRAARGAPEVP